MNSFRGLSLFFTLLLPLLIAVETEAQTSLGTAFTYQGRLVDNGSPADGVYDIRFFLYDSEAGGSQIGDAIVKENVPVETGLVSLELDFGVNIFEGDARWLDISIRPGSSTGSLTVLSPRLSLTPAPYSIFAATAGSVSWNGLTDVPSGFADGVDSNNDDVQFIEIVGIVGSGENQVARGNHHHDSRYYLQSDLISPGSAAVAWENLIDVPTGFEDNIDNTDDSVQYDEISSIIGSGPEQVAGGAHEHFGQTWIGEATGGLEVLNNQFTPSGYSLRGKIATGSAVMGETTGGNGVFGYSNNYGVFGYSNASSEGTGYGGYFYANRGVGVYGESEAQRTAFNAYAPGVYGKSQNGVGVYGSSTSSSLAATGVYGQAATGYGVRGRSDGGYGIYGYSQSNHAVRGFSNSSIGGYFTSEEGNGIRVEANGADHFDHGAHITSNGGYGVLAQSAENQAVRGEAGDVSGSFQPSGAIGVVGRGENRGVYGTSKDGSGVYGSSISSYAGYFYSTNYRGLFSSSASGYYAAYLSNRGGETQPGVYIDGTLVVTGSKSGFVVDIAVNDGPSPLETGDVVIVTGHDAPVVGDIPLIKVQKAAKANSTGIVGIVDQPFILSSSADAGDEKKELIPKPAAKSATLKNGSGIAISEYLSIVTHGSFRAIKVDASFGAIQPGDLLVASENPGYAKRSDNPRLGTIVGKALGELAQGEGTIPVMVTLQ